MNTLNSRAIAVLLGITGAVGCALAQGTAQPSAPGNAPAPGASGADKYPGPGVAPPMGPWRSGPRHTPGWSMMTEQERQEHHARLRDARTPEDCQRVMDEHRQLMEQRAKARGLPMNRPPNAACAVR